MFSACPKFMRRCFLLFLRPLNIFKKHHQFRNRNDARILRLTIFDTPSKTDTGIGIRFRNQKCANIYHRKIRQPFKWRSSAERRRCRIADRWHVCSLSWRRKGVRTIRPTCVRSNPAGAGTGPARSKPPCTVEDETASRCPARTA